MTHLIHTIFIKYLTICTTFAMFLLRATEKIKIKTNVTFLKKVTILGILRCTWQPYKSMAMSEIKVKYELSVSAYILKKIIIKTRN